ncbi:hypothetical protein F4604DRAFT_428700 [Suillus subluteus]|nr:hypothetical protein F4604DRAFT_428700 [Suillus subluteus]
MPSQLLTNKEFPDDDQDIDISVGNVGCTFVNAPSLSLPYDTTIVRLLRRSFLTLIVPKMNPATSYNDYQWHFAMPQLGPDLSPFMMSSPSAESLQIIFVPQSTIQPTPIPLQSDFLFHCRWVVCENITCNFRGTLEELRVHCSASHFGPKDAMITCQWEGCAYYKRGDRAVRVMRQDSMWRHTRERHLFLKRSM